MDKFSIHLKTHLEGQPLITTVSGITPDDLRAFLSAVRVGLEGMDDALGEEGEGHSDGAWTIFEALVEGARMDV